MQHLFDVDVAKQVVEYATKLHGVLENLNRSINDRSVNAFDFLFKRMLEFNKLVSSGEPHGEAAIHSQNLMRNLFSMGLEVDPVSGDGDCAFSSIIKHLYKVTEFTNDRTLIQHLQDVGLGNDGERVLVY